MHKLILAFGTRPELIKLAPLIKVFETRGERSRLFLVNTGQHRELEAIARDFGIETDYCFQLERQNDSLSLLNGLLLLEFDKLRKYFNENNIRPHALIAQGDTCSTVASAQFALYERIPFIHIEAGLRTGDFEEPFPEEYLRKVISMNASLHFAPTVLAANNLIAENIPADRIFVTGNTVIDNLVETAENEQDLSTIAREELVLVTIHRRENIYHRMDFIVQTILGYCTAHPEKQFLWIDNPGYKIASRIPALPVNLSIHETVNFAEMLQYYKKAQLIITDSGGIQEEACYMGVPVLVMRKKTERTESIDAGLAKYFEVSDTDLNQVIACLNTNNGPHAKNLYGDGTAAQKIYAEIIQWEVLNKQQHNQ